EDPEDAAAHMRDEEQQEREREIVRAAERGVEQAAQQKCEADGRLHAAPRFACEDARKHRADGRADAARRIEHADAACDCASNRKNFFTEDGEQREYAATQTPSWFDE